MLSHPILANPSVKGSHPYKSPRVTVATISSIHPQICKKVQKIPSLIINHLQCKTPPVNKKNRHYNTLTFAQKVTKNAIIDNQSLTLPNTPSEEEKAALF